MEPPLVDTLDTEASYRLREKARGTDRARVPRWARAQLGDHESRCVAAASSPDACVRNGGAPESSDLGLSDDEDGRRNSGEPSTTTPFGDTHGV